MGRYLGPKERLSRRVGVDLGLKGERALLGKGALNRRSGTPGQHGLRPRRSTSTYAQQLLEKQKARFSYGIREKQFRRYVSKAINTSGTITGEHLMTLLERRLDNIIYRLGFAATRAQARQFVNHGHVLVNDQRLDIASAQLKPGDSISFTKNESVRERATAAFADIASIPGWLEGNGEALTGRVLRTPTIEEIDTPVNEQLIIEFYSRV